LIEKTKGKHSVTVDADMDVREIMKKFGRAEVSSVGVVDKGKVIGQISTDRILAKLIDPKD
jgi:glycine betaine/proline transport system ATP-binding protein